MSIWPLATDGSSLCPMIAADEGLQGAKTNVQLQECLITYARW